MGNFSHIGLGFAGEDESQAFTYPFHELEYYWFLFFFFFA